MLPQRSASVNGVVEPRVLNLIANKTDKKRALHDVNLLRYLCDKSQVKKKQYSI